MDLGLDCPEALDALRRCVETIELIEQRLLEALPTSPADLGEPGSDIERLLKGLPDPPVDIRLTIFTATNTARACLSQIRQLVVNNVPTSPEVLAILTRTALITSCRLLFIFGPDDTDQQRRNAIRIMRQESDGIQRCYSKASRFEQLRRLIPPAGVLDQQRRRHIALTEMTNGATETELMEAAAPIVGAIFRAGGYEEGFDRPVLAEQLMWVFNIYSGVAHGLGWPRLVPGTESLPGDFTADLWMTVCAAQLAVHRLVKAHERRH